jgi:hypothetical protein
MRCVIVRHVTRPRTRTQPRPILNEGPHKSVPGIGTTDRGAISGGVNGGINLPLSQQGGRPTIRIVIEYPASPAAALPTGAGECAPACIRGRAHHGIRPRNGRFCARVRGPREPDRRPKMRDRLFQMAREWMEIAMHPSENALAEIHRATERSRPDSSALVIAERAEQGQN